MKEAATTGGDEGVRSEARMEQKGEDRRVDFVLPSAVDSVPAVVKESPPQGKLSFGQKDIDEFFKRSGSK